MTTAATIPMKWADKNQGSMKHCACCGRKLTSEPVFVEVIDGGGQIAAPGLGPDQNDSGYMGFFPVGRTCAKKHFRGFTHAEPVWISLQMKLNQRETYDADAR